MASSSIAPDDDAPVIKMPKVEARKLQPLDVKNFFLHWPVWSDEFQIHLAANHTDYLDNTDQLPIFWKCLGDEGSDLASTTYPSSSHYRLQYAAPKSFAFLEVWWRLNELCHIDPGRRRPRDYSAERLRLRQSSPQDIERDQERWLLLVPHLSLCDLEVLVAAVPGLDRVVRNHSNIFGVSIERCCLETYSVQANTEGFKKHESISSITLKDLSESEARKVLALFKDVKHLAMHNIVIYEDIRGFPQDLSELRLIDCKVEKELMMKWLSPLKSTLLRLGLDCFKHSLVLPKPKSPWSSPCRSYDSPYDCPYSTDFDQLGSLSINGDLFEFEVRGMYLDFYSGNGKVSGKNGKFVLFRADRQYQGTDYNYLHPHLEYLWIMRPVKLNDKFSIDRLKVKNVVVLYEEEVLAPEEPNLIFEMLNEYCLLEIADYLSVSEWMNLGQMHWKMEMALVSYKYPRSELTDHHIRRSYKSYNEEHINYIGQFVTKCKISDKILLSKFSSLKSWAPYDYFRSFEVDLFDALPHGLEKLVVTYKCNGNLRPYFRKFDSSLRVLEMSSSPGVECLSELHNLREIEISNRHPIEDFMVLLKQNTKLQRIKILCWQSDHWSISEKLFQQIGKLEELKDLGLDTPRCDKRLKKKNRIIVANLLERVGSQLTHLLLPGNLLGQKMLSLAKRGILSNIREFHLKEVIQEEDVEFILPIILAMTNLKKLFFHVSGYYYLENDSEDDDYEDDESPVYYDTFDDSNVLLLIQSLPGLVELELPGKVCTIGYEMELRTTLKTMNRQLLLNKIQLP